jgi:formiminoglutamase
MDIFNPRFITRAPDELFYTRHDPKDVRLGERVPRAFGEYGWAQIVMLGCPQHDGVLRNRGRPGAANAPTEIRRWLYRMSTNGLHNLRLLDLGDLVPQESLEATHALQRQWMQQLLRDNKRVIVLGGGNDISYPDCAALADVVPAVLAFNVDAHYDVREDSPCNSGTPYRQLLEEGCIKAPMFYEVGSQPLANSPVHAEYLRDRGVNTVSLAGLRELGVIPTFRRAIRSPRGRFDAIFWGFDLDVVRACDAPGVSAPNALGLSAEEFCEIAALAGGEARTRVVEFTEVNPAFDVDGRTARLAATAIWHYLAAAAGQAHT